MTREQMIDAAVRRNMARVTMKQVDSWASFAEGIRRDCTPKTAHPRWWEGTIGDVGLEKFPGRVQAIRNEFQRMEHSDD